MDLYPQILKDEEIFPVIGKCLAKQKPVIVSLSDKNKEVLDMNMVKDMEILYHYMEGKLKNSGSKWSLSEYMGERKWMIEPFTSTKGNRNVHIGIDIGLEKGAKLYAPLDAEVVNSEYEDGLGNYGGLVVLKHNIRGVIFYSLYGHLDKALLPEVGAKFKKGEKFAAVGEFRNHNNGFYHTHMQILTQEAYDNGWVNKGYCKKEDIQKVKKLCPNPMHLLVYGYRYRGD